MQEKNHFSDAFPQAMEAPAHPVPRPTEQSIPEPQTDKQKAVLETLQAGVEGILTSEGYQAYLRTMAKFHQYSFANSLLIHAQNPDATRVAGYRKWQELGRQVRKGETAIKIFVPFKKKMEDPDTGEERSYVTGFGLGNVFDIASTDGEPLPERPPIIESTESSEIAAEVNRRASRFLIDRGLLMESKSFHGSALGFWNPNKHQIVIKRSTMIDEETGEEVPTGDPLNILKTKTLLHEGAHYLANHGNRDDRQDAEVVAESSAFVALQHFDIDTSNYTFGYVAGWGKAANRLRVNLGEVQRVSNTLISAIEGAEPTETDSDVDGR
jgi:antirestriction protein ArdC